MRKTAKLGKNRWSDYALLVRRSIIVKKKNIYVPFLMQVVVQIIKYSVKKKIKIKYSVCGRLPNLAKTAGAITLDQLDGQEEKD